MSLITVYRVNKPLPGTIDISVYISPDRAEDLYYWLYKNLVGGYERQIKWVDHFNDRMSVSVQCKKPQDALLVSLK